MDKEEQKEFMEGLYLGIRRLRFNIIIWAVWTAIWAIGFAIFYRSSSGPVFKYTAYAIFWVVFLTILTRTILLGIKNFTGKRRTGYFLAFFVLLLIILVCLVPAILLTKNSQS